MYGNPRILFKHIQNIQKTSDAQEQTQTYTKTTNGHTKTTIDKYEITPTTNKFKSQNKHASSQKHTETHQHTHIQSIKAHTQYDMWKHCQVNQTLTTLLEIARKYMKAVNPTETYKPPTNMLKTCKHW